MSSYWWNSFPFEHDSSGKFLGQRNILVSEERHPNCHLCESFFVACHRKGFTRNWANPQLYSIPENHPSERLSDYHAFRGNVSNNSSWICTTNPSQEYFKRTKRCRRKEKCMCGCFPSSLPSLWQFVMYVCTYMHVHTWGWRENERLKVLMHFLYIRNQRELDHWGSSANIKRSLL